MRGLAPFTIHFIGLIAVLFGLFVSSCNSADDADEEMAAVSVSEILNNRHLYVDREVKVKCYLVTHTEGPWIFDEKPHPLKKSIGLDINPDSKIIIQSKPEYFFWWYQTSEPFPVEITGIFRIKNLKINDLNGIERILSDQPRLEVIACERLNEENE